MTLPEGVTVVEQWAVHSDDGEIYRVSKDHRRVAEQEAELLQVGDGTNREPGAAPARRYVMTTPNGEVATDWHWTVGWKPETTR